VAALAPGDGLLLAGIGAIRGRGSHDSFVLISCPGTGRAGGRSTLKVVIFLAVRDQSGAGGPRSAWAPASVRSRLGCPVVRRRRGGLCGRIASLRSGCGPVQDGLKVSTRLRAASRR